MKRAAPQRTQFVAEQITDAPHHFTGGLVREREQQNSFRRNSLFQKIRDAIGERARLARTRAGDDERRAGRRGDGGELLRIEFARVINLEIDLRLIRFQDIFARHGGELNGQTGRGKRKNVKIWINKDGRNAGKEFSIAHSYFPAFLIKNIFSKLKTTTSPRRVR